jgi:hypothetical protein
MGLGFRVVKILDIMYITVLFFIAGFGMSRFFDSVLPKFDEEKEKESPLIVSILKVIPLLCLTAASIYILRNLVGLIPSPFEGLYGLEHLRIKEYTSSPILTFTIFYYQDTLQDHLKYIYNRISM